MSHENFEIKYCVGGCRQYSIISPDNHYECSDCASDRRINEIAMAINDALRETPSENTGPIPGPGVNRNTITGRRYQFVDGEWHQLRDVRTQDDGEVKRVPPTILPTRGPQVSRRHS